MNKTFKIYGIVFLAMLCVLALLRLTKKEVTDWRKNFDLDEKSPFGLYIFNHEADHLLKDKISRISNSPYSYYSDEKNTAPHNILVIQQDLDQPSWQKILACVQNGSDLMIFSTDCDSNIQDTLKIRIAEEDYLEKNVLKLTDRKFLRDFLYMDKFPASTGFSAIGKNVEILGKYKADKNETRADFVRINFGKGHVYFHSDPTALTNYYLLKPYSERYIQDVFSYLPDRKTLWFTANRDAEGRSASPLSFVLSMPPLRYAWWLFLAGLLLFALFNAKRRQRVVPIIEPVRNKSVEFVKSIGNLYLQEGDFHDMMAKKAQYFLSRIRMDLLIDTQHLDQNFAKKLQLKTGADSAKIIEAITLIKKGQDPYSSVMKEDLARMNQILDEILK